VAACAERAFPRVQRPGIAGPFLLGPSLPLPLLLASEDRTELSISVDPEGGAHGCAPFFYEAGCRLEKSRRQRLARLALYEEAFSLVRFFDAYQRNELGRAAGETLLILALFAGSDGEQAAKINSKIQKLSPSATSFLLISVKETKQRKTLPRTHLPQQHCVAQGFF